MHEFSIAEALARTILEQCAAHGVSRVTRVRLAVGRLRGVVADSLTFYLDMLLVGSPAEGAEVEVDEIPITLHCSACGRDSTAPEMWALFCPHCQGPVEVTAGRELTFISMEAE